MQTRFEKLWRLLLLKAKFAMTSGLATLVDWGVYFLMLYWLAQVWVGDGWQDERSATAQAVAYGAGAVVNFILQRYFIFDLNRKVSHAFALSMTVSLLGLLLSTGLMYLLHQAAWLAANPIVPKLLVTGLMFLYNFYLKRYAFERKFI